MDLQREDRLFAALFLEAEELGLEAALLENRRVHVGIVIEQDLLRLVQQVLTMGLYELLVVVITWYHGHFPFILEHLL